MDIGIICFTMNGFILAEKIDSFMKKAGHETTVYTKSRYLRETEGEPVKDSLKLWAKKMFETKDAVIFIGAAGIAVRAIAPYVDNKTYDPAVVVLDEQGKFCISLLSGHLGGANELTEIIGRKLGAIPVITTATDVNGQFAVDVFAKKNRLYISNMTLAKEVSARLLHGEKVGFISELPIKGEVPAGLDLNEEDHEIGIYVGIHYHRQPFEQTLWLIPRSITAGIGCRKGVSQEQIEELFEEVCQVNGIFHEAVAQAASIELKKEEPGLKEFCQEMGISLITYSAEELLKVEGDFSPSEFVQSVTGVDNVCERSAVKGSRGGTVIQKKTGKNGVTVAFAQEEWSVEFE
ncbi:MAG: cobalt-precorrin 5A hydrolase [Ruminococcus sp.]|jgi:cobalt-precorrin 5A hydrolase